ncbi:MAG TPA: succinate dehydrogenase, hydrophobic membrane anchor protein [Caulobacteraceae bacterium]|jgi:succinate dehydrogenase / fumarate reductase membrane anchor subunit|nr:succinate dehydrogenase, hydrophobic membrane anchor protein [Caulobacteraceae bacterium]
MASYRTPLGRVRGLGSAKHGVGHFIGQRVSAVALIVLVLWGVYSALVLAGADFASASAWMRSPWHAVPLALFVGVALYHARLGIQIVIEDYIHKPLTRNALLILNVFVAWLGAAIGVFSILKVAFGGGAL